MYRQKELTQEEIKELEKLFKYSFIMYESDILRFKFDIGQFKPNVAYEIKFMDLMPLYNEWYYKYSKVFLNLMKKTYIVIKAQGREDTFLLFLTDSDRGAKRLRDLSKMKSFKLKANFTRAERSLLSKLNGFSSSNKPREDQLTEHIKGGLYFEHLQDTIKEEQDYQIAKQEIYEIYDNFYNNIRGRHDSREEKLKDCLSYLKADIEKSEKREQEAIRQEDNLLYSITEEKTEIKNFLDKTETNITYNEYKTIVLKRYHQKTSARVRRALEL